MRWNTNTNKTSTTNRNGPSLPSVAHGCTTSASATSPTDDKYEALSDDGSSDSGESLGIQIPQGYLSNSMTSNSLDVSTSHDGGGGNRAGGGSTSSSSIHNNRNKKGGSSSSPNSKSKKNNDSGNILLPNMKSVSPRAEQNEEYLRRLVALAKHPNPQAAARAVAAANAKSSSGSSSRGNNKSRSSGRNSSSSRNRSSSTKVGFVQGADGRPIEVDAEPGDEASFSSSGESSDDDSRGSGSSSGSSVAMTTFAANLGSRHPPLESVGTSSTEDEEEMEMEITSDPIVWEDETSEGGHGSPNERASQRPASSSLTSPPSRRRGGGGGGILAWVSVLFAPSPGGTPSSTNSSSHGGGNLNESMDNATDQSLASKEQYSLASANTDKTPKIANLSPTKRRKVRQDIESGHGGNAMGAGPLQGGRCNCKRLLAKRSTVAIVVLCTILFVAIVTTIVAALYSSKQKDNDNGNVLGIFPGGSVVTRPPTSFVFSQPPSATPPPTEFNSKTPPVTLPPSSVQEGSGGPTKTPSLRPTPPPSKKPTPGPTRHPTTHPTNAPTTSPSAKPTSPPPTASPTTSRAPTLAPTTAFGAADLELLGEILNGSTDGERFGYVLASSGNGNIIAVGAPLASVDGKVEAGVVQVYELRAGEWVTRGAALFGRKEEDQFGSALALSNDGQVLVVSEPTHHGPNGDRSGNVRAFTYSPMNRYEAMGQEIIGEAATDHFGVALTLSGSGLRLAAGAPYHDNGGANRNVSGNVRVFQFNQQLNEWERLGSALEGSSHLDWFGWGLDMNFDGTTLAVGAPRNLQHGGYVRCYQLNVNNLEWELLGGGDIHNDISPLRYDDSFGHAVAVSTSIRDNVKYHRLAIGSPGKNAGARNSGLVAVYEFQSDGTNFGGQWSLLGSPVIPTTPGEGHQFGYAIDLHDTILAVGIPGSNGRRGQVNLYQYTTPFNKSVGDKSQQDEDWQIHPTIDPVQLQGETSEEFGFAVQLVSTNPEEAEEQGIFTLLVGSPATSGTIPGKAHVYQLQ